MAPVDWKKIMAVDVGAMDEDDAEAIFELIAEYDPPEETDPDRLVQLFLVTQTVMSVKAAQADIATEELEQYGAKAGKSGAQDVQKYEDKIADLESEMKDLKRFGGGASKDTRFVREEIHDLEKQVEILQEDLKNAERDLRNTKEQEERYASRVEELEKEQTELKRENEMLQDEIRDYRQQLDSVRERMQVRRGEDADLKDKVGKKNRELVEALDEIQHMTEVNIELRQQIDDISKKLQESVVQMEITANEHSKLKAFVQQSDENIDDVRKENDILKVRIADLQDQLEMKQTGDDEIMQAVNEKVEEWKLMLAEKDSEVLDYHQQVRALKEQISVSNIDSERASIGVLTKAVEERDRQIRIQQDEISRARTDLESSARVMENIRKDLQKSGKGPSDKQVLQIRDLNEKLADARERVTEAENYMRTAEDDASEKDKAFNEALERMRQYEEGEYGLKEAVDEIKSYKGQVGVRDRQIGELTQHVNKSEMRINDLQDENEQLREKLGIHSDTEVDLATYRLAKNTAKQQDRALNQVLQKEIEVMEEERIDFKKEIRRLAQKTGQRAAALGLTDDIDFVTQAKRSKKSKVTIAVEETMQEEVAVRAYSSQLQNEADTSAMMVERATSNNEAMRVSNQKLQEENRHLQAGLEELMGQIKEGQVTTEGEALECPTLERLLSMMETRRVAGDFDAVVYQKARADNLEGRVDELRKELRESRNEHGTMKLEVSKLESGIERLQSELEAAKDPLLMTRGAQVAPLPKSMTATSQEIVASVNEYLIHVIQDVHLKEELLKEMTSKVEIYKRKFAVVRHQLGTVYSDYVQERKSWDSEKKDFEKKICCVSDEMAMKETRLHEFDRLLDTLNQSDDEIKRRLAEESRKITVAKVNETNLTRRYNALLDIETAARRENNKLKSEMIEMELAVTERVGYLLRYKDMAAFKIEHLHRELENSVPVSNLDEMSKKHCQLTEKYRDLLEKGNLLVSKQEELRTLEVENAELKRFSDEIKKILEIEKEKSHVLETRIGLEGVSGQGLSDTQASSISKKLTMLEMKELNERQRAEHAQRMYDQVRSTNHVLETRNIELESKFAELTETVLVSQRTEQKLRDDLECSVTRADSDRDKARIMELEIVDKSLRDEIGKLKLITEISILQATCLDAQQVSRDKENFSLRQQLLDIQQYSDEKSIIGKLHRQIVRLQVSEGAAVRKFQQSKKRILALEAHVLRLEEVIDDKQETFSHKQAEHRSNTRNLKKTIQSLRENFSGALPLRQVERLSKATSELQANRAQLQSELKKVQDEKSSVEDQLAEIQLKHEGLNELICTLQDGTGAKKVAEWHEKMESLRLEELKLKRTISKLKQQCKYLEGVIAEHEQSITTLEEENVKLTRDFEERQVLWEQREIQLETKIDVMEKTQAKITSAAASFTAVTDALPDANMPVPEQLDFAVITIKKNVKTILDVQAANANYRKKHVELTEAVKRLERDCLTKDRIIAEMRLRMPANSDREGIMRMLVNAASNVEHEPDDHSPALKIAQSTISSLQARIASKEETVAKYQTLLEQARDDLTVANKRHDEEMQMIQEKLHSQTESAFSRFKQVSSDMMRQPTTGPLSKQQVARLRELEDVVCQQDNSIAALAGKLKQSRKEADGWKHRYDDLMIEYENDKGDLIAAFTKTETEFKGSEVQQDSKIKELENQVVEVEKDLHIQKSMNDRAPTVTMKKLVDKLKNQLTLKEKQHTALTKALSEVRTDMLSQAEAFVVASNEGAKSENNVQKLIQKQTGHLQDELIESKNQINVLTRSNTKHQESERELKKKVNDLQNNIQRKEKQIQHLNGDKLKVEQDNLELENRLARLKASKGKSAVPDAAKTEVEQLRRTVVSLENELRRKRDEAEKPYEKEVQSAAAVTRWEENKAIQKTVSQLKAQLREANDEVVELRRQLELTKKALITANKDKQTLKNHLKSKPQTEEKKKPLTSSEQYEALMQSESFTQERAYDTSATPGVRFSDTDLSNMVPSAKIRQLSEENIELRFERDSMQKDIPRLKSRIQDLHNYIEVLRSENADLKGTSRSLVSGTSGASSSIRRLGESGKSTRELEKTIMLLKKVIERLQLENERLKKSPGVLLNDNAESLQLENEGLKNQLSELREKFGASLSNRYESSQKGMAKVRDEYDKLRKDLRKEVEINQKLRIENRHLDIAAEKLKNELTVVKSKLEIKEGSQRMTEGLWSNTLSQKITEEKVQDLLLDNEKNTDLINQLKSLLKESTVREQKTKQALNELNARIDDTGFDIPERSVEGHPLTTEEGVDGLLHEVVDLQLENKQLLIAQSRLQHELEQLKRQIATINIGEFEQLKLNYQELLIQNSDYERKIEQVEQQFGIKL